MNTIEELQARIEKLELEVAFVKADNQRMFETYVQTTEHLNKTIKAAEDFRTKIVAAFKLKLEQPEKHSP